MFSLIFRKDTAFLGNSLSRMSVVEIPDYEYLHFHFILILFETRYNYYRYLDKVLLKVCMLTLSIYLSYKIALYPPRFDFWKRTFGLSNWVIGIVNTISCMLREGSFVAQDWMSWHENKRQLRKFSLFCQSYFPIRKLPWTLQAK